MLQVIIKGIFWVITKMFSLLVSPFFSVIYALFPDVATYFTYINSFLLTAFTYFASAIHLMLIPQNAMLLFFDYLLIKYSIYLVRLTIKFSIKVYTLLKP